jgi:hypothetical protein
MACPERTPFAECIWGMPDATHECAAHFRSTALILWRRSPLTAGSCAQPHRAQPHRCLDEPLPNFGAFLKNPHHDDCSVASLSESRREFIR